MNASNVDCLLQKVATKLSSLILQVNTLEESSGVSVGKVVLETLNLLAANVEAIDELDVKYHR